MKEQIEDLIRNGQLTEWFVREVKKHDNKGLRYHEVPPLGPLGTNKLGPPGMKVFMLSWEAFIQAGTTTRLWRNMLVRPRRGLSLMCIVHHLQDRPLKYFEGENSDIMFIEEDAK